MPIEIPKAYEPKTVEPFWADYWLKQNLFSPNTHSKKPSYVIVIPPPNVTGSLHMGHALNNALQDILIRWKKMCGYETLWVPGTDHGGIATQNVVEKLLKQEKKSRHDLGREKFLERMWQWRKESGDTILFQLQKLGCSLDWKRTRFTMDETCSKAVFRAFIELYKKGWIYRGKRMVNWCVRCQTALSDIEVEYEERKEHLYYIRYPIAQLTNRPITQSPNYIVVATTRPETMLGDTAVAVHPDDPRYKEIHGCRAILPFMNREIEVIADSAVEPEFGTGAVKVTPAHDPIDFEIGQRKKLEPILVIGIDGKMTVAAGPFAGLSREECRKQLVEELKKQNLMEKIEDYTHSVGVCYRCSVPIEPQISDQWFLKTEEMAKKAIQATNEGLIKISPDSWTKPYLSWLENLKDWCISRQIWWGHRIPVWYCVSSDHSPQTTVSGSQMPNYGLGTTDYGRIAHPAFLTKCPPIASVEKPKECPKCKGKELEQDPDVLDTWFSSALWPFSVFGWPEKTADLKKFYPTSVLVTGHEILYLWVARMVMFGLTFNPRRTEKIEEQIPFREVFIHGIVRDAQGRKMSKSLGNVIDPLTMMEKYGTDALRFVLASQSVPGRDMQISNETFVGARNFCNKIWNAARFVLMNIQNSNTRYEIQDTNKNSSLIPHSSSLQLCDRWILSRLQKTIEKVNQALSTYDLAATSRTLYHFVWSEFCDWYIELSKIRILNYEEDQQKQIALSVAMHLLKNILQLLHPIMPFITEEIWKMKQEILREVETVADTSAPADSEVLSGLKSSATKRDFSVGKSKNESILFSPYPQPEPKFIDEESEHKMGILMRMITEIRTIRSEMNVHPAQKISVWLKSSNGEIQKLVDSHSPYLQHLCKASELSIRTEMQKPKKAAAAILPEAEIYVPLEGLIDFQREQKRLTKELAQAQQELKQLEQRLAYPDFKTHAPKDEIVKTEERRKDAITKITKLQALLESLNSD